MKSPIFYRDQSIPNRFYYIPTEPVPEMSPNEVPTLSLWVTNNDARLQMGVRWTLSKTELEQLLKTISLLNPSLTLSEIDLQPAQVRVQAVDLLMCNSDGVLHPIATASSSGFPPFTTLFAVQLNEEQKTHAVSALHGRPGFLVVRFTVTVLNDYGDTEIIESIADISSWFADRTGSDHIHVMPTHTLISKEPTETELSQIRVELDELLKSAPIAFINLEHGSTSVFLRPLAFESVQLPLDTTPIRCTTHYTVGKPYSIDLTNISKSADHYVLTQADIGVAAITVTAKDYQAANAREVRVRVRYIPESEGTEDDHTIYLRGINWQEQWWVITRHATLNGSLEVTAKITEENGTVLNLPRFQQKESNVFISKAPLL